VSAQGSLEQPTFTRQTFAAAVAAAEPTNGVVTSEAIGDQSHLQLEDKVIHGCGTWEALLDDVDAVQHVLHLVGHRDLWLPAIHSWRPHPRTNLQTPLAHNPRQLMETEVKTLGRQLTSEPPPASPTRG